MTGNDWFTAGELANIAAERGLENFPQSESGVIRRAKREGWNDIPHLCRTRGGSKGGGGIEYHRSRLPGFLQDVIGGREIIAIQHAAQEARRLDERKKVAALPVTSLRFRQRQAMEARGEILLSIDRYAAQRGYVGRRKAILDFVAAQEHHAEWLVASEKSKAGEPVNGRQLLMLERPSRLEDPDGLWLLADTLRLANDRCGDVFKVSLRTVQRWFSLRDGAGITALAPALTNEEEPISEEFKVFLTYYARPSKPAATEALKDYLKVNPSSTLSIEQVRYTLKHKLNDIERNVGREGLLTLRSRMAYIQRSTENLFPTTIYTADGKTFDAEVAHPVTNKPFKPEITSILDVATRKCVGFAVSLKENVIAVTEALRKSCETHGICAIFYVDRGPGYKNKTFDADSSGLMVRLYITKMHALPYNSQAKGIIERFNGTVWNPLAKKLPTYLGKPMDKEAAKAAHKETRRDLKEFGSSRLLPSWDDFRAMCAEAVAEYNDTEHHGLPRYYDEAAGKYRHYTPNQFWALHVADGFEPVPVDADEIDDLFRPTIARKVQRGYVSWKNNTYHHPELELRNNEWVLVGYDFDDASKVWVREIDHVEHQPGRLICVASWYSNKRDYVPTSVQQQAEEKRTQGRVKRLEDKLRDARQEFIAPYLIEQPADEPMPMIDLRAEPAPAGPVLVVNNTSGASAPAVLTAPPHEPVIRSKQDLARFAIANPDKLNSSQVRVLRDCLNRQTEIELFLLDDIDVDVLTEIVRAAA